MTRVVSAPKHREHAEDAVPAKWSIKDVERITGLKVVDIEDRTAWVVCILDNGVRFSFRKW